MKHQKVTSVHDRYQGSDTYSASQSNDELENGGWGWGAIADVLKKGHRIKWSKKSTINVSYLDDCVYIYDEILHK